MSNQEMQFADPEWRPPDQRGVNNAPQEEEVYNPQPINTDPREQPTWQATPPQQERPYMGPGVYAPPGPQQMVGVPPRQRRRGRGPWFWIIIVLIIIALSGGARASFSAFGPHSSIIEPPRQFAVNGTPNIVINDNVGTIHVHTGSANDVTVTASRKSFGFFGNADDAQIKYNQQDNTITVNVGGSGFFDSGRVDLDVTVPSTTDLQLKTDTGEIDVTGVNGQMSLQTDTGTINATGDTLTGQSSLKADTGAITFNGSLDANGSYQFQTDTGAINVTLPSNSAFHLDATTDTGAINTNIPGVNVQHPDMTGAQVHTDIGTGQGPTVTLKTDTGAINLQEGQ